MSHILHLGHQPTDLSGAETRISTTAGAFDPTLDVNGLGFSGNSSTAAPFVLAIPEPAQDLWLGFRYRTPSADAGSISRSNAMFLELRDGAGALLAQVKPRTSTNGYHAIAHGDDVVEGATSFVAPNATAAWIDLRLAVGAEITVAFHVDGILRSTASAPNVGGKGRPRTVIFTNTGLHGGSFSSRSWFYAHIAVLDGVSTIGRRFVRRVPDTVATFEQMIGSIDALKDGSFASRVASTAPGQRLSFSLTGPTGPAAVTAIAGVHLKQISQGGTDGPQATAGFLHMAGMNHDAAPVSVPVLAPAVVFSSWSVNPADGSPWTDLTLPGEVGILSA